MRTPLRMYIDAVGPGHRRRPEDAPAHDPQLLTRALNFRKEHKLMSLSALSRYNISVWKLQSSGGAVEYLVRANLPISVLEKQFPRKDEADAKVGLHSEPLIAADICQRADIRSGSTTVTQIYTERAPCKECQIFLWNWKPAREAPYYYYLQESRSERAWAREQVQGSTGHVLLQAYGHPL